MYSMYSNAQHFMCSMLFPVAVQFSRSQNMAVWRAPELPTRETKISIQFAKVSFTLT
jgi:hypothetical protein